MSRQDNWSFRDSTCRLWRKESIRPFLWDCSYKEGCRCIAWHGPRFRSYVVINAELRILKETQWILFQYTYIKKKSSIKSGYRRNWDFYTFTDLCISVRNVLLCQIIGSPCWVFWFQQCQLETILGESMSNWSKELYKLALPLQPNLIPFVLWWGE